MRVADEGCQKIVENFRVIKSIQPQLLAILIVSSLIGCSGPKTVGWRETMRQYFADSAIRPTDPDLRFWTLEDEERFLRRIGFADVVAVGPLYVVAIFSKHHQTTQLAYLFRPEHVFYGKLKPYLDAQGDLLIPFAPGGFASAVPLPDGKPRPLGKMVLMLKRVPTPTERHWRHEGWRASLTGPEPPKRSEFVWSFYRPDPALVKRIETMYRHLQDH